jgi:hypothetical protein
VFDELHNCFKWDQEAALAEPAIKAFTGVLHTLASFLVSLSLISTVAFSALLTDTSADIRAKAARCVFDLAYAWTCCYVAFMTLFMTCVCFQCVT